MGEFAEGQCDRRFNASRTIQDDVLKGEHLKRPPFRRHSGRSSSPDCADWCHFVLPLRASAPSHRSKGSCAAPASAGRCPALRGSLPPERGERCAPRGRTDDCRRLVSVITSTETDNRSLLSLVRRDPQKPCYFDLAVSNPQRAQLDRTRSLIGPG